MLWIVWGWHDGAYALIALQLALAALNIRGVFKNDPAMIAGLFHEALTGPFRGAFAHVCFAVLDGSEHRHVIGPFQRLFAGGEAAGHSAASK